MQGNQPGHQQPEGEGPPGELEGPGKELKNFMFPIWGLLMVSGKGMEVAKKTIHSVPVEKARDWRIGHLRCLLTNGGHDVLEKTEGLWAKMCTFMTSMKKLYLATNNIVHEEELDKNCK